MSLEKLEPFPSLLHQTLHFLLANQKLAEFSYMPELIIKDVYQTYSLSPTHLNTCPLLAQLQLCWYEVII